MILTLEELADHFGISKSTAYNICRRESSPAFKIGAGSQAKWRCDPEKMERFLVSESKSAKS